MAENNSRTNKKISPSQQKELLSMMGSFLPPPRCDPRSGAYIEYSNSFWENVMKTLNRLESDPIYSRDQTQWRKTWRSIIARVKKRLTNNEEMTNFEKEVATALQNNSKIKRGYSTTRVTTKQNNNEKMTSFEEEVANSLQNISLQESNDQVEEEDEDSVENIQVQPDINETLPDEPVVASVRAVGFVDQANIDQVSQHSQDTYFEQTYHIQPNEKDYAQPSTSSNDQRKSKPEASLSRQITSTPRNARIQHPLTQIKTESDELDQPSTSTNQNIKSEPGTSQASPSPSTSRQNANSATNDRKGKPDEDNSADDKLTRQLASLIISGKRLANLTSEVPFFFQTVVSIAETFQGMREQRQQETFANTNGFRTENMTTNTSSVPQETFANTNGLRTENMTTNTSSVPQNPSSHENGANERSE